jgi:hypothetical protein
MSNRRQEGSALADGPEDILKKIKAVLSFAEVA